MAGKIPQSFLDDLINRVDIVDIIDARVPLKKAGRDYSACCPFHDEKTPSFTVSRNKQFYHCFGCGAHGSAIGFLMQYNSSEFLDAVEELAAIAGVEIPYEGSTGEQQKSSKSLYDIVQRANQYYQAQLRNQASGREAIEYLKSRGLEGTIANRFAIGYAPPGWDNLVKALGSNASDLDLMLQAGLIAERDHGGFYDRLRERIVFPIRDRRGRVIGFGGRIFKPAANPTEEAAGPKYLNSPETPIFNKGRELYGLYEARKATKELEQLLVVEGYMDVVALAQHGFPNAVATLGTATTEQHLEQLFRATSKVCFCFDGDKAGKRAAWRALELALGAMQDGRTVSFLFLPEGEDPDSMIRSEGHQAFEDRLNQAVPLSEFLIRNLTRKIDIASLDGRSQGAEIARPLLDKLPDTLYKNLVVEQLAKRLGVRPEQIGLTSKQNQQRPNRPQRTAQGGRQSTRSPIRLAIGLLLQHPTLAQDAKNLDQLAELKGPGIDLLKQLLEILLKEPHLKVSAILERWRDREDYNTLCKLAAVDYPGELDTIRLEFQDTLKHLVDLQSESRWRQLQQKLSEEGLNQSEINEWNQLLKLGAANRTSNTTVGNQ